MATQISSKFKEFDGNGDPLSGGKVWFYVPGTTTPKDTYSNQAGTVANSNPVILDSRGEAAIWGSGLYDLKLTDSDDVEIYTMDNVGIDADEIAATPSELADMDTSKGSAYVSGRTTAGDGYEGTFVWVSGDQSANVTNDPQKGVWVAPSSDATGASGAWKRDYSSRVNVKWFGAIGGDSVSDSAAVQAAWDAYDHIRIPSGEYEIQGITIDGPATEIGTGKSLETDADTLLINTASDGTDMFVISGSTATNFLKLKIASIRSDVGAGHVFNLSGTLNHSRIEVEFIDQNETSKSIINHSDTSFFFNIVKGLFWSITTSHTVPAINMSSTSNRVSANTFDIQRPDRSGSEPFMSLTSTSASDYNYGNDIRLANPEECNGGVLLISRTFNTEIRGMHCFDTGTTVNHMVEVGQSGYLCQNTKIKDYQRNSGTLGSGLKDIMLTDANYTYIENPCGVSSGTSLEIDLNSEPNSMVIGGAFNTIENAPANAQVFDSNLGLVARGLSLPDYGSTLEIASGEVTIAAQSAYRVDTEASASTDDLDTINGGTDGKVIILRSTANSRDVTLKDGTGNLYLSGDFTLSHTQDRFALVYDELISGWVELAQADNNT